MRILARLAGVCLTLLLFARPLSGTGILVTPTQMGMVIPPGQAATEVFRVSASRSEKTQVRVRVVEFEKSSAGETLEPKDGAPERSCARWVRVEPLVFETAESGWTEVRISVTVPAEARGTYWALVIFQVESAGGKAIGGRTVVFRPQLQVPLLVTAGGTEARSARIENLSAIAAADGTVEVSAEVFNTGNTGLQPTGSWVLERRLEPSGEMEELQEKELASFLLLPGHSFRVRERLAASGLPQKNLSVHLYMVYGVEKGQIAEAAAEVHRSPSGPPTRVTPSPNSSRTPGRNTRMSLRDKRPFATTCHDAGVHLVPARDFSSGRGRPTTAMSAASQRRSDEVSGGKDPRDGRSRS